jgi:hypothetical protein
MDSALIAAFQGLQLDLTNDEQTVAFEALCWKHILHHTSLYWLQQAQTGKLPMVRELQIDTSPRKTIYLYDHTLNRLTFEFVEAYASSLWPSAEDKRSHLTANANANEHFKLKAVRLHTRVNASSQARLERELGHSCTEQIIVAESVLGCRVREFLKELVRTREAPSVDGYSAELALQTVLGSVGATAAAVTPSHPPTTTYDNITSHAVVDLRTPPPCTESILPADARTSVPIPTSERSPAYWSHTQMGTVLPDHGTDTQMGTILPDRWTDTYIKSTVSVSSSIAAPHEAGPVDDSNHYTADVISLSGSSDEEDNEGDVSGLLCPHDGCQLRFPDWASFEDHAQLPHNDSRRASKGGEMSTTNIVTDFDYLQEIRNSLKRNGNGASSTQVQQELFLKGPVFGNEIGWRNTAGERV